MDTIQKSNKLIKALKEALPIEIWESTYAQAKRSDKNSKFRVGAVIFDDNEIIGKGCSYVSFTSHKPSIHAEEAAITNALRLTLDRCSMAIMSIGKSGNPAFCSKPCFMCLTRILKTELRYIFWPERDNAGNWTVCCETPIRMYDNAILNGIRVRDFARYMRV